MKRQRQGEWPFSEADVFRAQQEILVLGERWRNVPDDYLVGLIGAHVAGVQVGAPILAGANAELQRRQVEVSEELTDVQRTLLTTIERFNAETSKQTEQMLTITRRMERLAWGMLFLGLAQLGATIAQIWIAFQ